MVVNLGLLGCKAGHKKIPFFHLPGAAPAPPSHQNPPDGEMKTKPGASHPAQLYPGSLQLNSDQFKTLFSLYEQAPEPQTPSSHMKILSAGPKDEKNVNK